MSAKKKKVQVAWVQCDACEIIILDKDLARHSSNCPTPDVPYVLQSVLYCKANSFQKNDESLKHIREEEIDEFVLLSQAALQLCHIPIGDYILVTTNNNEKFVKRAWKGNDRLQLSVAFNEFGFLSELVSDKQVTIRHMQQPILRCQEIIIDGECELPTFRTLAHIKYFNCGKVFCPGSQFQVLYFGKRLTYRIIEIIAHENNSAFYKAMPDTIWKFNHSHNENPESNSCGSHKIGGYVNLLGEVEEALKLLADKNSSVPAAFINRGLLLSGPNGVGKSLILKYLAKKWSSFPHPFRHFHFMNITGEADKDLTTCFTAAEAGAPAIVTIDDLDATCSFESRNNVDSQFSTLLASIFDRIRALTDKHIVVLATCNDINKIDKSLRRPGRFDKELEVSVPNPQERMLILQVLLENIPHSLNASEMKIIADNAHGFVGADLAALVSNAASTSIRNSKTKLQHLDLLQSLSSVRPSALREITVQVPDVKWVDIGGQQHLKLQLRQAVEWPLKYSDSFIRLGISPPRGVLMYGPPGCSKTMIAKALATESGLNFISVKGPELFSKWVGDSEKAVREVFRKARQSSPCIVFFDELDALAGERTSSSGGAQVQERVLAQLLTELDGVEALGHVIVVGATNRPDRIDPALLRPGRLDRIVHVPLPDYQTRVEIFAVQFRKTPVSKSVCIDKLAKLTEGYSGAEVVAVCHEAALNALQQNIKAEAVTEEDFLAALRLVTPRTPNGALETCQKYAQRNRK